MLENKCILITGATSGIGRHFAEYASRQGATVVLVSRREEQLKEIQDKVPGDCYIYPYDLYDIEHIRDIFDFVKKQGITLDALVHCAGIEFSIPVRMIEPEDMERVMRVNALSFIQLGRFFSMKKYSSENSSIVAMSSISSLQNPKGMVAYNTSKTVLNSSVSTMAKEFAKRKIRVNAIAPAFVDTPMMKNAFEKNKEIMVQSEQDQFLGFIPPEQISYLIEFLLSERGKYITGTVIPVSGGMPY